MPLPTDHPSAIADDQNDGLATIAVVANNHALSSSSVLSDAPNSDRDPPTSPQLSHASSGPNGRAPTSLSDTAAQAPSQPEQTQNHNANGSVTDPDRMPAPPSGLQQQDTFEATTTAQAQVTAAPGSAKQIPRAASGVGAMPPSNGERTPTANNKTESTGRGRRKPGRPKGSGRGGRRTSGAAGAASRGGKRKRDHNSDDDDDGDTTSSEEFVAVSMTKSGRAVQKPTTFVPPPPPRAASPSTQAAAGGGGGGGGGGAHKRKRVYRRNPEAAVCKVCLRGTSPTSNMIVFCDGCNSAYHRFCHHPPIDQSVVDEIDKEWYCGQCEKARVEPVPEAEIEGFVAARTASLEQRQRFFASLAPGMLVTLLTRATTLYPDLPVFPPDFVARPGPSAPNGTETTPKKPSPNGRSAGGPRGSPATGRRKETTIVHVHDDAVPDEHPPTYPRPGHGVMKDLRPPRDGAQWLVDDGERFGVFTHLYQVDPREASAGLNGVKGSTGN